MHGDSPSNYRIAIDEQLLRSLFLHPINEITKKEIREVEKVATVIFNKYFRHKYGYLKYDLKHVVILAVLNRHANFDPQYRAYNYIYTIARNEMGNFIKKVTKEHLTDDLIGEYDRPYNNDLVMDDNVEIARYLAGEFEGAVMDIPNDTLYPTLLLIETFLCNRKGGGNPYEQVAEKLLGCLTND